MFGRKIRETNSHGTQTLYWGARAIYTKERFIDILHNRQTIKGDRDNSRADEFFTWINNIGLPAIRQQLANECLPHNSYDLICFRDRQYYIEASPPGVVWVYLHRCRSLRIRKIDMACLNFLKKLLTVCNLCVILT